MRLYLIKVTGRPKKNSTRMVETAILVADEERLLARGKAMDYFLKYIGDEVLSVQEVEEMDLPTKAGVLLGFRVNYDPAPVHVSILLNQL